MKLLDTLLTQAIKQSTGFDAGGLVRKIGGSNLLLAGGALLAGGLAVDHMRQKGHLGGATAAPATGVPPATPPPAGPPPAWLPPLPPQASAPPAPPGQAAHGSVPVPPATAAGTAPAVPPVSLPAAAGDEAEVPSEVAHALVRTMIAAALADGRMTAEERAAVRAEIGKAELSPEQVRELQQDMVLPLGPDEIAGLATGTVDGELLYRFAAAALAADGQRTTAERAWLDRLGEALALDASRRGELDGEVAGAVAAAR